MKKILLAVVCAAAVALTACGPKSSITKGSASKFDSLSYAAGVQLGGALRFQMRTIPLDYEAFTDGLADGALGKGRLTMIEAMDRWQEYQASTPQRRSEIMKKRKQADSIRLANGDSTKVNYPMADPEMFENDKERADVSYALGVSYGANVATQDIPFQTYWVCQGVRDMQDGELKMSENDANMFWYNYNVVVLPAQNQERSEAWLAKVEKQSGVQKTESGLLYKVVAPGDMSQCATNNRDKVKVHYKGTKANGKVFDASRFKDMPKFRQEIMKKRMPEDYAQDEPAEFPLNGVIKGWSEGMKLIGPGGKIILWIPSDLAYGPRGNQGIGGNEALRFDVELLEVTPFVAPKPVAPAEPAAEE